MAKQDDVSKYLAKIGSKGGKAAALKMTKEQRSERARKAVEARLRAAKEQLSERARKAAEARLRAAKGRAK